MQAVAILLGGLCLLWPALYNTYPILFSDTGGLLEMGLRPAMGWDKPFVYGPLLAAISLRQTLWLPVFAQTLLLSYSLWCLQRALCRAPAWRHLTTCLLLSALTAAPWFASTLMPDLLTSVAAIGLLTNLGHLPRIHRLIITLVTTIAIAAHLSHLLLAPTLIIGLIVLTRRMPWSALASLAAALLFLLASNLIGHGRAAISPFGAVFALARLIADGPARDYLAQACPNAGYILCPWRDRLTDDSDQFLWDAQSPFWSDPSPLPEFAAEAAQIVVATIRADPLRVARDAYRNAAAQFIHADLGDTLGAAHLAEAVRPRIATWFPAAELRRFDAGRQIHGTLVARLVTAQRALLALMLVAAAVILLTALRTPNRRADLAALILLALAANALATGSLSTVHDRYAARLAWIILLPGLMQFRPPSPASSPEPPPRSRAAASP